MIKAAFLHDSKKELARYYRYWENAYPETLQWRSRKAYHENWWDKAAAMCLAEDVPPALLLFVVGTYSNSRAEDAEIPFSANSMRSESVMRRAVANFRRSLGEALRTTLEPVYILKYKKALVLPESLLSAARLVAELSSEYFKTMLMVQTYELRRNKQEVPVAVMDTLSYNLCEKNPFLLLQVAQAPRTRAIAAVNAFKISDKQPWHEPIWSGIASEHPLFDLPSLAGGEVDHYYENGHVAEVWPFNILDPAPLCVIDDRPPRLGIRLLDFKICDKTDLFLATKLDLARSGSPNPYDE